MKKIRGTHTKSRDVMPRLMSRTGSHCPANGFWVPEGDTGQPVFMFQGSIMPTGSSGAIVWALQDARVVGPPAYPLPGSRISGSVGE